MIPTRTRAMLPTRLRRQTATPGSTPGGRFNLSTPAGKNNALLAAGVAVSALGLSYYMGYWDEGKAKEKADAVKDRRPGGN